jgi:hypothetical protein
VVGQASTTTALKASADPSVFGQSVTFTATVSVTAPGAGSAGGSVTFYNGATTVAILPISGGRAVFTTSTLTLGSHSITAAYSGNIDFKPSTSAAVSQAVGQASTTTHLSASADPSVFGQSVTFTATVSVTAPGAGSAGGSVTFYDGASPLTTVSVSGGRAVFTTSTLALGSHSITATYSGNTDFKPSTSAALSEVVKKDATRTVLTAAPNPSTYGQTVTLTAVVSVVAPGHANLTGQVTFYNGATAIGTVNVASGKAVLATNQLPIGADSLTAVYAGDADALTSTSAAVIETVRSKTTTTLTASPNPATAGQSVTFTATVIPVSPGTGTPTGTVTFRDGTTVLATESLVNGVATFTDTSLTVGTHAISATYNGATGYVTSVGRLSLKVNPAPTTAQAVARFTWLIPQDAWPPTRRRTE